MGLLLHLKKSANGVRNRWRSYPRFAVWWGPLAGGDPVFWFTVQVLLGALGASLAASGSIVDYLFFFGWNAIRMALLWYTQESVTKLDLGSLKTCLVVSWKTSLKVLLSLVCSSLPFLYNIGYPSSLSTFQANSNLSEGAYINLKVRTGAELKGILGGAWYEPR